MERLNFFQNLFRYKVLFIGILFSVAAMAQEPPYLIPRSAYVKGNLEILSNVTLGGDLGCANTWGLLVGGSEAVGFANSASGFGNVGMGTAASTSDSLPLLIFRSQATATAFQVQNDSNTAGASSEQRFQTGTGANETRMNFMVYGPAQTLAALGHRGAIRVLFGDGLSYIASESAATHEFYIGGQADTNEILRLSSGGMLLDLNGSLSMDSDLAFDITGTTTKGTRPWVPITSAQMSTLDGNNPPNGTASYDSDSSRLNIYDGSNFNAVITTKEMTAATITCDSDSTIDSQDGSWISSVGNVSGGSCSITISGGVFAATPRCWAVGTGTAGTPVIISAAATSTTAAAVDCAVHDGTDCTSYSVSFFCRASM